ncbi:MAG: hyalin, partial [Candidatus Sumerlaeota bacterium]|nr:hyalin [Candidatus Sumerlaeota bacterium]
VLLFFVAKNQIWKSDGTLAGTVAFLGGVGKGVASVGNKLVLSLDDGISGGELWVSDGSVQGTTILKDIVAGAGGSNPDNLTQIGNQVYFVANDNEIWMTDGSVNGTIKIGQAGSPEIASPDLFTLVGNRLFLAATDVYQGRELWGGTISTKTSAVHRWLRYE